MIGEPPAPAPKPPPKAAAPPPPKGPQLPGGFRSAVIATLVLSAMVGFGATRDLAWLFEPPSADRVADATFPGLGLDPAVMQQAVEAMLRNQVQGFEAMRWSRTAILMALSVLSSVVFVSAMRLLRPAGVPREGVRRLLGTAAVLCALLRTLDGAQMTAVFKRAGGAFDRVFVAASDKIPGGYVDGLVATGYTLASIGLSVVFAGGYALLASYYRSERTQQLVRSLDDVQAE